MLQLGQHYEVRVGDTETVNDVADTCIGEVPPDAARDALGQDEHVGGQFIGQVAEVVNVLPWDDEQLSRANLPDFEEGNTVLVLVNEARRSIALDDLAEDARGVAAMLGDIIHAATHSIDTEAV